MSRCLAVSLAFPAPLVSCIQSSETPMAGVADLISTNCTPVRLYNCTTAQLYDCATVQLYNGTTVHRYNCITTVQITVQLCDCTTNSTTNCAQLYNYTSGGDQEHARVHLPGAQPRLSGLHDFTTDSTKYCTTLSLCTITCINLLWQNLCSCDRTPLTLNP